MTFTRIKTFKDRHYMYEVTSYREGGKMKQRQKYLGRVEAPAEKKEIKKGKADTIKTSPAAKLIINSIALFVFALSNTSFSKIEDREKAFVKKQLTALKKRIGEYLNEK